MSIFSHLIRSRHRPREIHFVYGTKAEAEIDASRILFLPRLMDLIAAADDRNVTLRLFLTGTGDEGRIEHGKLPNRTSAGRMTKKDVLRAVDGYEDTDAKKRRNTVCYICGPPRMTDQFVAFLSKEPGLSPERVLCEKWW